MYELFEKDHTADELDAGLRSIWAALDDSWDELERLSVDGQKDKAGRAGDGAEVLGVFASSWQVVIYEIREWKQLLFARPSG